MNVGEERYNNYTSECWTVWIVQYTLGLMLRLILIYYLSAVEMYARKQREGVIIIWFSSVLRKWGKWHEILSMSEGG